MRSRVKAFNQLVLAKQSIFGLPWVILGALLPLADSRLASSVYSHTPFFWAMVISAFLLARIAGMSFNRLIDREIDTQNPRTQNRPLPAGAVSPTQVKVLAWSSLLLFFLACAFLNPLCFMMSPMVALQLILYSYTKRWTALCHFVLGSIHFLSPIFAWVAVTGSVAMPPIWLGFSLWLLIAGNDMIYAIQDMQFDMASSLKSVPVALGVKNTLRLVKGCHVLAGLCLVQVGLKLHLSWPYWMGILALAALYTFFHKRLAEDVSCSFDQVFYLCNTWGGIVLLAFSLGALL